MRYQHTLTTLANTIATHTVESLRREIQATAFSKIALAEKQEKLQNFKLAETFIKAHPALPDDFRTSLDCFKTLADYFIQAETIEDHKEKAMCCWYLLLNQAIPNKVTIDDEVVSNIFPYEAIIPLGKVYLSEPYQFAGFICWLLTRRTNPYAIKQSSLLRQFAAYHSWDFSNITHTYDLIRQFSELTHEFLNLINEEPCLIAGLTNTPPVMPFFIQTTAVIPAPKESNTVYINHQNNTIEYSAFGMQESAKIEASLLSNKRLILTEPAIQLEIATLISQRGHIRRPHTSYESYNVMGTVFAHKEKFPTEDSIENDDLEIAQLKNHAITLLQLFGFEWINRLLSTKDRQAIEILPILINSPFRESLLDAFANKALNNEIDYPETYELLKQISLRYHYNFFDGMINGSFSVNPETGDLIFPEKELLKNELLLLIKQHPFYIHLSCALDLPPAIISEAIEQLLLKESSKNACHIPFLVSLSRKLNSREFQTDYNNIIYFISQNLITMGDDLPDRYHNILKEIKQALLPHFQTCLNNYIKTIDHAIDDFLFGKIEYHVIEQISGEQLRAVNLIKQLNVSLWQETNYPHGTYALKNRLLEKGFMLTQDHDDYLNRLTHVLYLMSDSIEGRIRILQECIYHSENSDYLQAIITYVLKQDDHFQVHFFHKPFGCENYVLEAILYKENPEWISSVLSMIPLPDEVIIEVIKHTFNDGSFDIMCHLLQTPHLSQSAAYKAISYIIDFYREKIGYKVFFEAYTDLLHPSVFSKALAELIFTEATKLHSATILLKIGNLEEASYLTTDLIEAKVHLLMQERKWHLVKLLCGLSNDKINHAIIKKNNLILFVNLLKQYVNDSIFDIYQPMLLKEVYIRYENENTLFHLAAYSGCYQTLVETITFFAKHLTPKTMGMFLHLKNTDGEIPHCPETWPDAQKINQFLDRKRKQYEKSSITDGGFWHNRDDKRMRTEPDYHVISDSETEDAPKRKATRTETFQNENEIDQLLRM